MNIHEVHEGVETYKKRKRLGRGTGSGLGKRQAEGTRASGLVQVTRSTRLSRVERCR